MIESPPTQIGFPSRNVQEADEALLARIGYKQELKREFSPFEIFAVCLMSMGLVPSIASVLFNSIPNGGPVAMIWGWIAAFPFILCIALGVAELASANPTSGGLYYWTHALSPPGCKNFMSWIVGYANTIANSIAMASVDWAFSLQLTAAVSMATDGAFVATQPQNFGIFIATLLLHGMVCTLCTKVLARLQNFCVLLEIFLSIVVIAVLPAVTPTELKNVPSYAFGEWTNLSGWPSGFAFFLSFLAPLWTVSGYDSSVHMSEEASNAAIAVPWATMGSVTLGFILGLALNISIAFCMGPDPTNIIDSPLGQPMAQIFYASLGKNAALALWSLVIAVQFFVGSSYLLVVSRQVFAFARDGALPFSRYVYSLGYGRRRRDSKPRVGLSAAIATGEGTPVFAVWMVVVFAMLTGLLSFAGAQAINAVFGMATAAGYVAYIGPMSARVLAARKSADETSRFRPGPFHLGSWSVPVLSVALAFMVFMIIIFLFPASPNINAGEMNYAVVVLGGTFTLVVVGYYFPVYGGVHWFRGPVSNIGVDGEADSGGNVGDFKDKGSETFRTVNA